MNPNRLLMEALLVSHYDDSAKKPLDQLNQVLSSHADLGGRRIKVVKASDKVQAAPGGVAEMIRNSPFIVAFVQPERVWIPDAETLVKHRLSWNPNVFFELGYAASIRVPVFAFALTGDGGSAEEFATIVKSMPFDARDTKLHKYDPEKPSVLQDEFREWLIQARSKICNRFGVEDFCQHIFEAFEQVQDDWESSCLLIAYGKRIRKQMSLLKGRGTEQVTLDLGEHLAPCMFETLIAKLGPGDSYSAVSTTRFWISMNERRNPFMAAHREACTNGATIRRLLVLRDQQEVEASDAKIQSHINLMHDTEKKYEFEHVTMAQLQQIAQPLGIPVSKEPHLLDIHRAIFSYGADGRQLTASLKPSYHSDASRGFSELKFRVAVDRINEFDKLWKGVKDFKRLPKERKDPGESAQDGAG